RENFALRPPPGRAKVTISCWVATFQSFRLQSSETVAMVLPSGENDPNSGSTCPFSAPLGSREGTSQILPVSLTSPVSRSPPSGEKATLKAIPSSFRFWSNRPVATSHRLRLELLSEAASSFPSGENVRH